MFDIVIVVHPGSLAQFNDWARPWAGFITVLGALVIFFSWVVENTLEKTYSKLAEAIDFAQRENALHSLLGITRGTIILSKKTPEKSVILVFRQPEAPGNWLTALREAFNETKSSGITLRELNTLTASLLGLSGSHPDQTEASASLKQLAEKAWLNYQELLKLDHSASDALDAAQNPIGEPNVEAVQKASVAVQQFVEAYQTRLYPETLALLARTTTAGLERMRELTQKRETYKNHIKLFGQARIWLYIAGSVCALYGQYLEKLKPR